MGYVGNKQGPRKSLIVANLGPTYFGITAEQLKAEIQIYKDEEWHKEIDPVYIDENRRPYLLFNAPGNKTQRYYLDDHGYRLKGKVLALINGKETSVSL